MLRIISPLADFLVPATAHSFYSYVAKMQYGETCQIDVEQEKPRGKFTVSVFSRHRAEIASTSRINPLEIVSPAPIRKY